MLIKKKTDSEFILCRLFVDNKSQDFIPNWPAINPTDSAFSIQPEYHAIRSKAYLLRLEFHTVPVCKYGL